MYDGSLGPVSNRAHWIDSIEGMQDDGTLFDWTTADAIALAVLDPKTNIILISASLADGKITRPVSTQFQWRFEPSDMASLCPGQYNVGVAFRTASTQIIEPLIIGSVQVLEGGAKIA